MKTVVYCGVSHRTIRLHIETPEECWKGWRLGGVWDIDPLRIEEFRRVFPSLKDVPDYLGSDAYEKMLDDVRPDRVFVCTRDCHHAEYAVRALRKNVDVVIEKPMVTTTEQARTLMRAENDSEASVIVAFNYRYQPKSQAIRKLVRAGAVGTVTAVEMNVYLDEGHGSSFFQRWNRLRANSGGLTIHKEGHYLDLVNWWIDRTPVELFGYAGLKYYGPDAELNPSRKEGRHCSECDEAEVCPYEQARFRKYTQDGHIKGVQGDMLKLGKRHLNKDKYTDYRPDMCIFDSEIDIEDTYAAVARYDGGAFLAFSVNFSSPFENYRLVINGTRGRIEAGYGFHPGSENPYPEAGIVHYPLFSNEPRLVDYEHVRGGHQGGDPVMLRTLYGLSPQTEYINASAWDGAKAVALGEAMWRSPQERRAIRMDELIGQLEHRQVSLSDA